jgi:release factor glutamine methyltransferase
MKSTITQALVAAQRRIDLLDARVLLCHVLARDTAYLIAHAGDPIGAEYQSAFESLVARRARGEPVAYVTGRREFFSLDFKVSPAALIPRPETEFLVELALERIPADQPCSVLDLGTGSGCVAIAIARHRPRAQLTATDGSSDAMALARENARALGVPNVEFAQGEWYQAAGDRRFDLIVSNPPYVAEGDPHLGRGDLRFEPRAALIGGADGLEAIRIIVDGAAPHLVPGGSLLFEHGHDQAAACRALLQEAGFAEIHSWRDLAGTDRVTAGRRREP